MSLFRLLERASHALQHHGAALMTRRALRQIAVPLTVSLTLGLSACGGGGGSSTSSTASSASGSGSSSSSSSSTLTGSNTATVTIGAPLSGRRPNLPFVSVTICVPGTSNCQTIDHIIVDTGSVGLRLMASAVSLSLPAVTTSSSVPLGECLQFVNMYSWGAVRQATYTVGGETTTASTSIHIIGDSSMPSSAPQSCTSNGGTAANTASALGANGLLGVGLFKQDCGSTCATSVVSPAYYSCASASSSCTSVAVPLAQQVSHPATLFATDNNGTMLVLPSVDASGSTTATGTLVFGIGTQSNNAFTASSVITTNSYGRFSVKYGSASTMTNSFIDSGSNGIYFNDASITQCGSTSVAPKFYCPTSTLSLSATLTSPVNTTQSSSVSFNIANAVTLVSNNGSANNALPNLGGVGSSNSFDFGLPFFYGRTVFTAIENAATTGGTGPFVAF